MSKKDFTSNLSGENRIKGIYEVSASLMETEDKEKEAALIKRIREEERQKLKEEAGDKIPDSNVKGKKKIGGKKIRNAYKNPRRGEENNDARLNLAVPPTMKNELDVIAMVKRKSVNSIINELIDKYIDDNMDTLEKGLVILGEDAPITATGQQAEEADTNI